MFLSNENERLCKENCELTAEKNIFEEKLKITSEAIGKSRLLLERTNVYVTALEKELETVKEKLDSTTGKLVEQTEKQDEVKTQADKKEKELLQQLRELSKQNKSLRQNIDEQNKTNASLTKQKNESFIEKYFTNQCLEVLEKFSDGEQHILAWSLQNGFDPAKASADRASKLEKTKMLRVNCMKKAQFDKHVETFDTFLQTTKTKQFQIILALHDKFAYELTQLDRHSKFAFAIQQKNLLSFKTQVAEQLQEIQKQIESMDLTKSKFFERFLNEQFSQYNQTQSLLLKRFRDHTKYTQEIRLPEMKSIVSSLHASVENFELKFTGIKKSHLRFLKHFKSLESYRPSN